MPELSELVSIQRNSPEVWRTIEQTQRAVRIMRKFPLFQPTKQPRI